MGDNGQAFEGNGTQIGEEVDSDVSTFVEQREYGSPGLVEALKEFGTQIFYPREGMPLIQRTKRAMKNNAPIIKQSARNSTEHLMRWVHQGGPWRAFLVISVGTVSVLSLTGLGAFFLFFLAATANAIVVGLLMSLAAVGGFMALFFTCLTAIYVGALTLAAFVISVVTLMTISAVAVVAGWIGFFWLVWQAIRKSLDVTRSSLLMTTSALAAMTANGPGRKINFKKHF